MKTITAEQFRLIEDLLDSHSINYIYEHGDRWFEAELRFRLDNDQYAKILRRMGLNPVDEEGNELGHPTRLSWDEYFLGIAEAVSRRADCSRRQVGAVVVDEENRIVSTGYNGSPPGGPSCLGGECPRATSNVDPGSSYDTGPGMCVAVHAEMNALLYAGRDRTNGSTLYVTDAPCDGCRKPIEAAGIVKVVWPQNVWWVG